MTNVSHSPLGDKLSRSAWVRFNRLRTGVVRFHTNMCKWSLASCAACEWGEEQTADHIINNCLIYNLTIYVTRETLVTLYHSLIHSRVQYGVISWGNAANIYLNKIQIRMNNIVKLITKSSKYFSINPQYKMLKILKLDEIYKLELAKFMHNLHHNNLPFIFKRQFTYLTNWHTHKTRCADSFNYFLPRVKKNFPKTNYHSEEQNCGWRLIALLKS